MNPSWIQNQCSLIQTAGPDHVTFTNLTDDSRSVEAGALFVAVRGTETDGHHYIRQALDKGARGVLCEVIPDALTRDHPEVWFARIENTRQCLGPMALAWYGHPDRQMTMMGVTGTNGKTTVATLIWQLSQASGEMCALLGTTGKWFGTEEEKSRLTTAGPIELARDLKTATERGCTRVAMEVSSHALDQDRARGIDWNVTGFTNLSHDHLDYHQTMERYAEAKQKLFRDLPASATAVINMDDPYGPFMSESCRARVLPYSFHGQEGVSCEVEHSGPDGLSVRIGSQTVQSPLVGDYNAENLVTALLMCDASGLSIADLAHHSTLAKGAPGRLERILPEPRRGESLSASETRLPTVFVDYAHTPDALARVAQTLSEIVPKDTDLIVLFGCGGDRDRGKRPEMARAVEAFADRVVITSDNPRMEDPDQILDEILTGFRTGIPVTRIVERKEAIRTTILEAPESALILLAGRGHETEQQAGGRRIPLDDRIEARRALEERLSNRAMRQEETC